MGRPQQTIEEGGSEWVITGPVKCHPLSGIDGWEVSAVRAGANGTHDRLTAYISKEPTQAEAVELMREHIQEEVP